MKTIKVLSTIVILTILGLILYGASKAFTGNYMATNPFNGILIAVAAVASILVARYLIRILWKAGLIALIIFGQSCQYAKVNQQVVVSDDCGMTWKMVNAGESVPKDGLNYCYMKVVIPNYPMQGESTFITNLSDKVRAVTHIDYDYSIVQPLNFIRQAKYLGKANTHADDEAAINEKAFEVAENMVIDKRIKEVAKAIFIEEDIVEMDQSDIEAKLTAECNKVLEPLGVSLNFITLTFDLDEQTRQAIDVSTAMKIYRSKGLEELGRQVMIQRSGAPRIIVENKTQTIEQKAE